MSLVLCSACLTHHHASEKICPSCAITPRQVSFTTLALLGLSLTACNDKGDTGDSAQEEPVISAEMDYGVPEIDNDGDGWLDYDDCDDNDPNTYPMSSENEEDNDACMTDADGDGYGAEAPNEGITAGTDCNDNDASIHPGAEDPEDDIDQNCDGNN